MKSNTKIILTTAAVSALALTVTTKLTASYLPLMAVAVSYVAVAILVALAALDYRVGPKSYLR